MADEPNRTGATTSGEDRGDAGSRDDLERRRRELDAALAARKPGLAERAEDYRTRGMAGFGYAMRLSSEFIAAVIVGVTIGWMVDEYFGISPWGLIAFLLLGFLAGILNVLRAAGLVADFGLKKPRG